MDVLVSAFERVVAARDGAKLLIVGTGSMAQRLRDQTDQLGLSDAVVFTGAVDHRKIPNYIGAMDVAVALFHSMDGFYCSPIKIFEYMAAGRCVVASRLGQIEEVITDGEHGLLCSPGDVESLAKALLLARSDRALRLRMGTAARVRIEQNYTWRAAATLTSEVVAQTVGAEARRGLQSASAGDPV